MSNRTILGRIKTLSYTTAEWTAKNPVLYAGETGYDSTVKKYKIGDGTKTWSQLDYEVEYAADAEVEDIFFTVHRTLTPVAGVYTMPENPVDVGENIILNG